MIQRMLAIWSLVPLPFLNPACTSGVFGSLLLKPIVKDFKLLAHETDKAMAPHSSTLAWKILWTEEPGRLQSMGSLRVGNDFTLIFSLSCIGEGNGNPLQCSCLENPRDGGAWWAAVYGVTQIRTRLKWLSSSSSILYWCISFWLTSLCIIGPSFIHLIRTDSNVFFLMAE